MPLKLCIFLLAVVGRSLCALDESQFTINNNKAIQLVNERFISFSVDPAVFFTRLPHREILLKLITHLSPAYLRVAGTSTQFLVFDADEHKATRVISDASTTLTFTPAMWWSLNEWLQRTNFTPIFGVNDAPTDGDEKWDAKRIAPLLDMTARMNVNCWWQIGFDCSIKGFEKYKEDLKSFRQLLDAFPNKKDKWQILGSDLSKCTPSDHSEILRMYLADLDHADAVMWEEDEGIISNFLSSGVMENLLGFHQATLPIWLSTPKSQHPIGFEDGITWAVEIGEAARKGFAVIFREPRIQEYYSVTPAFWVTVLHKALMGRNVLDVKISSFGHNEARVYAHCARDQNSFTVRGALTIMIVNNSTEVHNAAFRFPSQLKSVEVRSYTLSSKENSTDTYLNNEKLTLDDFNLLPKLRRAKVLTHLMFTTPAKSIAFYVLPAAKIPVCIDSEDDTALILEEIDRIQAVDFADSHKIGIEPMLSRVNAPRVSVSLADLHRKLQEELKTDAALVPKLKLKSQAPSPANDWQQLSKKISKKVEAPSLKNLNLFLDSKKSDSKLIKGIDLDFKNLLNKDNDILRKDAILGSAKPKPVDLDLKLSSGEVFKILGDRAKAKLERKIGFGDFDFDLDGMLESALKRKFRRDINMQILEEKVHDQEQKGIKKILPSITKKVDVESKEIEGLPDMSKIIPGFDRSKTKSAISEDSIFGKKALPKFDFFGGVEKFDLQSLLSLLGSKTTTEPSTEPTTPYMKVEEKTEDFYKRFHKIDDSNEFYTHFGDSISIKPKENNEVGAGWEFDDTFFNKEFIINDDDVPGAIRKLENYFNQGQQTRMQDDFEPAFDSFETFGRYKRGVRDFIHRMRQHKHWSAANFLRNFGRRPRSTKDHLDEKENNAEYIIKPYESKVNVGKETAWRPEDMLKLPQLHTVYKVNERTDQIAFEDIPRSAVPSLGLPNAKRINIRKARRIIGGGDIDSVENTIDDFLNTIESDTQFIKPLLHHERDGGGGDEEFTIVLPTREQLSLRQESNDDTEIVLHREGGTMRGSTSGAGTSSDKDNQVDDSTCAATDLYPLLGKNAIEHGTSANDRNAAAATTVEIKQVPEKRVNRSEYVQKIPFKPKHSKAAKSDSETKTQSTNSYNLAFVANIVNSFSRFMKKVHNKVDSFFKAVE